MSRTIYAFSNNLPAVDYPEPKSALHASLLEIADGAISLGNLWQSARAKAGHPRAMLHDLRRTAARDLIKSGVDRDTAKRLIGHETDSIFTRYRIVAGDDLAEAAARVSAYRNPPPKKAATRTGLGTIGVPTAPRRRKEGPVLPMKRKALAS